MKKLLLDENIPTRLRVYFSPDFEVYTVKFCGWTSVQNGALLTLMKEHEFYALITTDKKLHYQQNLIKYGIRVIIIDCANNSWKEILPYIPKVEQELKKDGESLTSVIQL